MVHAGAIDMMSLRFTGDLPWWLGLLLAVVGAALAFAYYRREARRIDGPLAFVLPLLRGSAILLTILILTGPVLQHRWTEGELGNVYVIVDGSQSMGLKDSTLPVERRTKIVESLGWLPQTDQAKSDRARAVADALDKFAEAPRIERVQQMLTDEQQGLIAQLKAQHHVRVMSLSDDTLVPLYDSSSDNKESPPIQLTADGRLTPLGVGLSQSSRTTTATATNASAGETASNQRTAIVLFSDGQSNTGVSPLQVARVLGSQEIAVHTIGLGDTEEPTDVAILSANYPSRVFAKNHVRGTLRIKDHLLENDPANEQSLQITIKSGDEVVWKTTLDNEARGDDEIEFDIDLEPIVQRLQAGSSAGVKYQTLPIDLQAEIAPVDGETVTDNNRLAMPVSVITQQYRVLLIDSRSRWESRYLKNTFDRDDAWQLTTVIPHDASQVEQLPVGDGANDFPADRAKLLSFDLVILGDVPRSWFTDEQLGWLREYVEQTGGGLVWIDGARNHIASYAGSALEPLLPVTRSSEPIEITTHRWELASVGERLTALQLQNNSDANKRFWPMLPEPRWAAMVEALPGSEVLAELAMATQRLPAIVSRRFGGGQVVYFATDETWRWRYQVADTYHQRFWNQLARWAMRRPMAVSDDYVALDSGELVYREGDQAEIRVRLSDAAGRGVTDSLVDAQLLNGERVVATVLLTADPQNPGYYTGKTPVLPAGEYEVAVQASGYPSSAMKARTKLVVQADDRAELLQLACDESLLKQIASESHGKYLPEEDWQQLTEILAPLSSGRTFEKETLLWQSYWWFCLIIGLLAAEWWLRKRGGLL